MYTLVCSSSSSLPLRSSKKQGAYGKIPTHQETMLWQVLRVDEVLAAATLLYLRPLKSNLDSPSIRDSFPQDELAFCDEILVEVSRSFAAVIRQLPPSLLVDIMVFYLVLRALDTIEDDMVAFGGSHELKVSYLKAFHKTALQDEKWKMLGVGQGHERRLLEDFPKVHSVYKCLPAQSQRIIADITQRMATGMAEFVASDLGQGTKDIGQYNRYCHFVAGLVGEGLSRLFASSALESPSLASELHLSDQMGLFLQKTNIIRDYLYVPPFESVWSCSHKVVLLTPRPPRFLSREDYVDKRAFWPQSVWKKYSATGDLGFFAEQSDATARSKSLECLNELVTDALELAPDCLAYMSKLKCPEIFRFCAIPQVMAIATLQKCYNNLDVFTGVVKIRKGLSCKLILGTETLEQVHETFHRFASRIKEQTRPEDPNFSRTIRACVTIQDLTYEKATLSRHRRLLQSTSRFVLPVAAATIVSRASSNTSASWCVLTAIALSGLCFLGPFG
jgi:farnesyl-diphosphate farnesyltransferase